MLVLGLGLLLLLVLVLRRVLGLVLGLVLGVVVRCRLVLRRVLRLGLGDVFLTKSRGVVGRFRREFSGRFELKHIFTSGET